MRNASIKAGDAFVTNEGSAYVVIEYIDYENILIEFEGIHVHRKRTTSRWIRSGQIKNPYHASVHGIGYFGIGNYVGSRIVDGVQIRTQEYEAWCGMLKRCYCPRTHVRQPSYIGCSVSDEWLNFQTFAEWYVNQPGYTEGWDLDKDLLCIGNKVYSEENCTLLPRELNSLLVMFKHINLEKYPRGIYLRENKTYRVELGSLSSTRKTKSVKTLQEAIMLRNENTEQRISEVINKYIGILKCDVMDALMLRLRETLMIPLNFAST